LVSSNKLPQNEMYNSFVTKSPEIQKSFEEATKSIHTLLGDLIDLKWDVQSSGVEINKIGKRKKPEQPSVDEWWETIEEIEQNSTEEQNKIIQMWNERTQLVTPQHFSKFKAVNQSILAQISLVLLEKDRLKKRTQLKRTTYRTLGKEKSSTTSNQETNQERDDEIFDDSDFYQQILKEVIDGGSTSGDFNPKERKRRKTVDRRASKGRKIRYQPHDKLVGFMTPKNEKKELLWDIEQLFGNIFGASELR